MRKLPISEWPDDVAELTMKLLCALRQMKGVQHAQFNFDNLNNEYMPVFHMELIAPDGPWAPKNRCPAEDSGGAQCELETNHTGGHSAEQQMNAL